MATLQSIRKEISTIPSGVRARAHAKHCPNSQQGARDFSGIVAELSDLVFAGMITIDDIRACGGAAAPDAATQAVASRAEALALDNARVIATVRGSVDTVAESVKDLNTAVDAIRDQVSRLSVTEVDTSEVASQIRAAVEAAFGPIKAAVTEENKGAVLAAASVPVITGRKSAADLFGVEVQGVTYTVWDGASPAVDPHFIWTPEVLKWLALADQTGAPVWLGGEKGTGKTQTVMQFAARTGRPFTRINFHKYSTAEEYLGATGLVDGQTVFVPGPFLQAFVTPGAVILLDELSNCDPGELAPLNAALERGQCRLTVGGQVWNRAPGVLVFGADNTLTTGDQSGRYSGTREMNAALADRFAWVVPFTFLPQEVEVQALVSITKCPKALATAVVEILNKCRAKVASGDILDAPSIRAAIAWIEAMPVVGVRTAWVASVASRQPAESALALEALYTAEVNEQALASACGV